MSNKTNLLQHFRGIESRFIRANSMLQLKMNYIYKNSNRKDLFRPILLFIHLTDLHQMINLFYRQKTGGDIY